MTPGLHQRAEERPASRGNNANRAARLYTLALLFLAGMGPIVLSTMWPAAIRQDPLLIARPAPVEVPTISFRNRLDEQVTLSDFRVRVVLLNIWATWCVPCREEMPALDRLEAKLGGVDFQVVALSVDRGGMTAVEAFFRSSRMRHLTRYIDESGASMQKLGIVGLPTTLLIDREGREVRRYVGAAQWDKEEFTQLIRKVMARREQ